ncbi:unhealthy ribosome biogenesis protein 2 homolog [Xiphophorus maculatus]|nr:unhealthy ribosome biogenesis protein 2 homolog [Xiphophorus maculatus]XP_023188120.1 unhealthy ribosome biogenesis protein 2 homolog [Xiphophorus maculatus]XP_023188121.1 unhealthy ribosome biogenesis protein 2 homolog [Xiphophorus maculatus]
MAAIYSGIHLKLKSPQTPWEDRLKLARFAWISSQCLLPNKEQVLLDWCTHALTIWHSKKVEFSQDVLEGLWRYLDEVVHSRKLHSFIKEGKTVTLRLNMAQLLLDLLQDCTHGRPPVSLPTILSVCRGILSSSALSSVFTTKYELMVSLLAKSCLLACHEIQTQSHTERQKNAESEHLQVEPDANLMITDESKTDKPSSNLFEVLLQVLVCYLSVQRQQANPNRVFTLVTNQLVQPLVLLRFLLTSQDFAPYTHLHVRQQLRKDVRLKIDSILQLALFPSEQMASYKAELLPAKEDSGKRGSGGTKGPLKPVGALLSKLDAQDYCEPTLRYLVKSDASSLMFRFFLESYGKGKGESDEERKMLCFYFLARLVPMLELQLHGGSAEQKCPPGSPQSWSQALQAAESLLSQALSADIYNIAADRIRHGEVQLRFYRTVAQTLLNEAQPSVPSWYRCLKVLLNLNHLILEPDLEHLLSSAWVNAENMEAQVQRARQLMVSALLQTYAKLRQLPHLFSSLLSVICQPAPDQRRPPLLSEGVSASLRFCLLDSSPSQVLEICSLVLQNVRTHLLPDLVNEELAEEEMEIDGHQKKEAASLKLRCLCQLLHVVLINLKTLDNSSPLLLVRRSKAFMEEMQEMQKDLLNMSLKSSPKKRKNKVPKWEQNTQEAILLLRYTWVEVDALFHIHCSKYMSVDSFLTAVDGTEGSPLLTHLEALISGAFLPTRLHPTPSCSPVSCLLLKLLTLQQMKKVLLDRALLGESSTTDLLKTAVRFIVAKSEFEEEPIGDDVWDGQIGGVNVSTYPAAHWFVVVSNLPLLVLHMSEEDVRDVADVLVGSLMHRDVERSGDQLPGSLSFSSVSSQLALSKVFPELPSVFSATVRSIVRRIIGVLRVGLTPKRKPSFVMVYEKETGSVPSGSDPVFSPLVAEAVVQDISASFKAREVFVLLTDTQTKELLDLIQILFNLNPDGMNTEDLSSIFLLLFFTFTSTSVRPEPPESGGDALFFGKLLRTLTRLLEGIGFPSVLRLVHGGTLLQTALASLLRRCRTPAVIITSDWLDLVSAAQGFIKSLVQLIITRNSSVRLNLDQVGSYLTSKEMLNEQPGSGASMFVHLFLASLTSFSQALMSNLGRNKAIDRTLTEILTRVTSLLGPTVESALKPQSVFSEAVAQPASALGQAFVVEVVTVMLRSEVASLENNGTLTHGNLYEAICQQILREMSSAPRPMDFLVCSLRFLSAFYKAMEKMREQGEAMEELYVQIIQNVDHLLKTPWLSSTDAAKLQPEVQDLLRHLVEKNTTSQFNMLLLMIREGLDVHKLRAGNWKEVLSAVITVELLSSCQLPETCSKALWLFAPQIISAMVYLARSASQDLALTLCFTVPTVTALTSLLRQGEGRIANPQHVTLVLGALQSLPLDHRNPNVYHSAFLAVHEALFAIIKCHPQVISRAAPSFLNVFYRLVSSIMQEGRQRGDTDPGADGDVYLQCSRLTERMFSHIAATPESFTALPAFMVAQYVTELQKVTLRPDVKLHLTEGVYCVLDLCLESDIKLLRAGLNAGVREVFNELYSDYTHYHKTQRQGEDKYTV